MSYLCFFILSVYEFILNDETIKVLILFDYIHLRFPNIFLLYQKMDRMNQKIDNFSKKF